MAKERGPPLKENYLIVSYGIGWGSNAIERFESINWIDDNWNEYVVVGGVVGSSYSCSGNTEDADIGDVDANKVIFHTSKQRAG